MAEMKREAIIDVIRDSFNILLRCERNPWKIMQMFTINPTRATKIVNGKCEKVDEDEILNEDDKNLNKIVCRRCSSVIFPADAVMFVKEQPYDLSIMTHQGKGNPPKERISWWWYTEDDMVFDTVGWQTINKKKVLMCGDCELGPIGYRSEDNRRFWVAVERVKYAE
ncbi:unnamed protein product [Caenorhabditis auriculariae]|uniref:Mss4 protein n=1 Tax=Caenorhabditis auriculariae TaxID=2777116 RepID=A0A8S1H5Z8_9PELO|nr:unnamed protein product [Caenorhabditis auriculariae]